MRGSQSRDREFGMYEQHIDDYFDAIRLNRLRTVNEFVRLMNSIGGRLE